MRVKINQNTVQLWLSANDTADWATRPGQAWPCSDICGHALYAEFDKGGLVSIKIGLGVERTCGSTEFNAIVADYLSGCVPADHPAAQREWLLESAADC